MELLKSLRQSWLFRPRSGVIAIPYIWLLLFFLVPFIIVLKISFAETEIAIPPYTDLVTYEDNHLTIDLNLGNYAYLFNDDLYLTAYLSSIRIAFVSTLLCLLIGYPMALAISRAPASTRNVLLLLVILPSWTSFLIRIYAWIGILKPNGYINNFLMSLGIIDEPIIMLHTDFAVYIGIVYAYLPFMILPLYANMMKLDHSLVEASQDLGASPFTTLTRVIVPLTKAGIIAGCMLVFIPAVGEFVIPELLGGPQTLMIGKVLWEEFFNNRDWPVASAVAIVMLALLIIPIMWFDRIQNRQTEEA
ncbi:ABC transporter permease subunit [Bowmanella sp. Y26]|uniref:ABC transporter permease subunit n=2 Tax=Bowmanella yangjiangensis TaxID=2811230 RepID=A0ABS3CSM8_9ALTE|nr:ABC transporter permease subunit [Bowmanella yangjiangensis]MBN7820127.1 ABC transporter permease subunit [Bowmanella yangjiangensis]MBT1065407.1 ABC transporter permease subunit [Bowmanella yangjiangensis]